MKLHYIIIFITTLLVVGCANNITAPEFETGYNGASKSTGVTYGIDAFVEANLLAQYNEWKGTPYKYNGLNSYGVDCSGFMYITFKSQFGIEMPRSTEEQAQIGNNIEKSELRSGDLVFFKTGFQTRHVGVYLSDSQFLHASTKRGVIISNLNNNYWKASYWKSKRILK